MRVFVVSIASILLLLCLIPITSEPTEALEIPTIEEMEASLSQWSENVTATIDRASDIAEDLLAPIFAVRDEIRELLGLTYIDEAIIQIFTAFMVQIGVPALVGISAGSISSFVWLVLRFFEMILVTIPPLIVGLGSILIGMSLLIIPILGLVGLFPIVAGVTCLTLVLVVIGALVIVII